MEGFIVVVLFAIAALFIINIVKGIRKGGGSSNGNGNMDFNDHYNPANDLPLNNGFISSGDSFASVSASADASFPSSSDSSFSSPSDSSSSDSSSSSCDSSFSSSSDSFSGGSSDSGGASGDY
jgi:hypothetical protein